MTARVEAGRVASRRARWSPTQRAVVAVASVLGLVARWWALGGAGLSFDESYTAARAGAPLTELPALLRTTDTHPPLDYLVRHPVSWTGSEWLLRAPSAVFATLALLAVVAWMRGRSWFGVGVVTAFAVEPFVVLHGRQARMYSLLVLLGVVVAVLAERWLLGDRRPALVVGLGVVSALACLTHTGGLLMAAGLATVPALGRRREDWWLRLAAVGGVATWAIVWGPSFVDQVRRGGGPSWVPLTSVGGAIDAVGGLAVFVGGTGWVVVLVMALGAACLRSLDSVLLRLTASLLGVPVLLLVGLGVRYHVLLPRALAPSAWSVPVLVVALVVWLWSRRAALGVASVVILAALAARSIATAVTYDEGSSRAVVRGLAAVEPGDGVLVHPGWLWPMLTWNGADADEAGDPRPAALVDVDGWYWQRPGDAPTGRTWVLDLDGNRVDTTRWPACSSPVALGAEWHLSCVVTAPR